jgi:hypothetical protein
MLRLFSLTLFLLFSLQSYSQGDPRWETIIRMGDYCRYFIPDSDIGTNWRNKDFDDSDWPKGQTGFGRDDGDDNTILPGDGAITIYLRFEFDVPDLADIADLMLDMDYDDGFVAYLNGTEVARGLLEDPISWNMEIIPFTEASLYNGVKPETFQMGAYIGTLLENGRNVLAVEVHNRKDFDMSSNVFLHAAVSAADSLYGPVPEWFGQHFVAFSEFNLPLVIIETGGQVIPDDPRITAQMGIINNAGGQINHIDHPWNEYSGRISIEQRGASSSEFAKKSYSLELQNADGSNNNVSVLDLPEENDFVLNGPYSDQTMMKNVLSYELFSRTGRWAPRTRFVELVLDDEYKGIYVFMEKLKRDEERVDIDKLTAEDVSPEAMSGGYILRKDKKGGLLEQEWWTSPVEQPYNGRMWYEYYDPKYEDLTAAQAQYIKDWMEEFDRVMVSSSFADPEEGYRKYIRTNSFIDFLFLNEISKGVDNYNFSNYFFKENDADGGQLNCGPPWDYNLAYGNLNYGDNWGAAEPEGWVYPHGGRTYWFERLMEDEYFRNRVACRWTDFRNGIYSDEELMGIIDSCVNHLGDAVERNFTKYPTLGNYVWPAIEPFPETYEGEISKLKTWLLARMAWLDEQWLDQGNCNLQAPTDILLSNNQIAANLPGGAIIGVLSTEDEDSDSFTYTFASGDGDSDNDKFNIFNNWLMSKSEFDYQLQNSYSIRIASRDESGEQVEKTFSLQVSEATSVDKHLLADESFVLYPNPSSGKVQLATTVSFEQDIEVKLLDLSGKVLHSYNGRLGDINAMLTTDSEALERGVYLFRIHVGEQVFSKRFIKL